MPDHFQALEHTRHMLQWLADEPYAAIRRSVEGLLREQVADSRLLDFAVSAEPEWLTAATRSESEPNIVTVRRAAVAFEFCLHVSGGGQTHELRGVYTWAAWHLDRPVQEQKQQVWLDLGGTLAEFGENGKLRERLAQAA